MELPDRKDLPDYYKVITNPVSLQEIEVSPDFHRMQHLPSSPMLMIRIEW